MIGGFLGDASCSKKVIKKEKTTIAPDAQAKASKTKENVLQVKYLLNHDRRMSIRMVADELSMSQIQVFEIVTENLSIRKVCAEFMPRVLSEEQKAPRKAICQDLLYHANEDPNFLDNVVTVDETWVFEYDPESKQQSSEWSMPR